MHACLLLGCLALTSTCFFLVSSHMIPDDRLSTNRNVSSNLISGSNLSNSPSIVIVELHENNKQKKNKKSKKPKKNKFSVKNKRPAPPASCVPLWGNCKTPNSACCDYCAFCHCRLFRTVCYCRMGNPRC